jgi:hypothetical protein
MKARLEKAEEELNAEFKVWEDEGLPNLGSIYRLNDNEFMHHVHVLALEKVLKEKFGLTDDEMLLAQKQIFLQEAQTFRPMVVKEIAKAKRDQTLSRLLLPPGTDIRENGAQN